MRPGAALGAAGGLAACLLLAAAGAWPSGVWAWAGLAAPAAWLTGLLGRRPVLLAGGLMLTAVLAAAAALRGATAAGLWALALACCGWDLGWVDLALARTGAPPVAGGWLGRAAARGAAATLAGVALALAFAGWRVRVPFGALVAGVALAWTGLAAWILIIGRRRP